MYVLFGSVNILCIIQRFYGGKMLFDAFLSENIKENS